MDSCNPGKQEITPSVALDFSTSQSRSQASGADGVLEELPDLKTDSGHPVHVLPELTDLAISNSPNLLSIPTEIQLAIISHLDFPAIQFLRTSNRHFMTLISALTHSALLEAEKSDLARSNNAYTCALCLRLRRSGSFADSFRMKAFGRDCKDGKQEKRFCIDCGVKGKDSMLKYRWGDTWTRFGVPYVKCRGCLGKKRGVKERMECPVCPSCWDRKNGRR